MPYSYGDDAKRAALSKLSNPAVLPLLRHVVDLGAGSGIWRKLSLEQDVGKLPWVAVEGFPEYVNQFDLRTRYSHVIVKDMRAISYQKHAGAVCIFGDVLEHLEKREALALFRRASSVCSVVVMMPFAPTISAEQGALNGNALEIHRYIWQWEEWLSESRALTAHSRMEIVQAPPGDERNKGVVIYWHPRHEPLQWN